MLQHRADPRGGEDCRDGAPSGEEAFCLVGVWETGDPAAHIDEDDRPTMNGASDCAGADVP